MRNTLCSLVLPLLLIACGGVTDDVERTGSGLTEDAQWAPCEDSICGEPCEVCAPDDDECLEPGATMYCNDAEECVAGSPEQICGGQDVDGGTVDPDDPPSEPCELLECGDPCDPCEGQGPDCIAPGATTYCDAHGACVPGNPQTIICEDDPQAEVHECG